MRWLRQCWLPYEKRNAKKFKKKFRKDRVNFSKAEALANIHLDHIWKSNFERKILAYRPKKVFRLKFIQKVGVQTAQFKNEILVPLNNWKKPTPALLQQISNNYCINLNANSNAEYVCKAPLKTGPIPSKVETAQPIPTLFFDSELCPKPYRRDISQDVYITGGWDTNALHMKGYSEGKYQGVTKMNFNRILMKRVIGRFANKPLFCDPKRLSAWFGKFRDRSGCGGETSKSFSSTRKGFLNFNYLADTIDKLIRKGDIGYMPILITGGRGKSFLQKKPGSYLTTRIVQQEDKVCFSLAKPFVKKIEQFLFSDDGNPIKIGKSSSDLKFEDIYFNRKIYKKSIEIDYKNYDSTVPKDKLICAFALMRGMFENSREIDNLFIYFCKTNVYKNIVLPDGNVILVKRGTPSGSAFTTVLNSFANCLCCEKILKSYSPFGKRDMDYVVNGDDTEIFHNDDVSFSPDNLIKWVKDKLDMDMKVEFAGNSIGDHPDEAPLFLKASTSYYNGRAIVSCPPKVLADRLARPKNTDREPRKIIDQILEQSNNLIQHPYSIDFLTRFIVFTYTLKNDDVDQEYQYNFWYNYIVSRQRAIFLGPELLQDNQYDSRTAYKGEKVSLIESDAMDEPFDRLFNDNWLYDNFGNTLLSTRNQRKEYLTRLVGKRDAVAYYVKKYGNFAPISLSLRYGLPYSEILFIIKSYYFWEGSGSFLDYLTLFLLSNPIRVLLLLTVFLIGVTLYYTSS